MFEMCDKVCGVVAIGQLRVGGSEKPIILPACYRLDLYRADKRLLCPVVDWILASSKRLFIALFVGQFLAKN
jgi:hypothetical protein